MAIARVPNISAAIKELKDNGLWVYGTAADGQNGLWSTDLTGAIALVIGSEGEGMSRLVKESCDFILSLPMKGQVSSLNASAAAAVTMYEVLRSAQRAELTSFSRFRSGAQRALHIETRIRI